MDREFIRRGRVVALEERVDLAAVKPRADQRSDSAIARFGPRGEFPPESPLGQAQRTYEQAGWVFVTPGNEVRDAVNNRSAPSGADDVQRVFVQPPGRVVLGLDQLSVRLREELSEAQARGILSSKGLEILYQQTFAPNLFHVRVPPGQDFLEVALALSQDPDFLHAEPRFIEHIPARFRPTDEKYGFQWHLNNTYSPGADIRAEEAWDITRGIGTRVAVVDHGFELAHLDLSGAVDTAQATGYFQAPTSSTASALFVRGLTGMPARPHGTFCAGLAVARAENVIGVCGVAFDSELIAVAVLSDEVGTQDTLARAIAYAADPGREKFPHLPGADVISCSLGPYNTAWDMTEDLRLAIDFAVTNGRGGLGTPVFWAADNAAIALAVDEVCSYANTIAVGCSTWEDKPGVNATGPELDFVATGDGVWSTNPSHQYGPGSGTSYAAPVAAGVAALLISHNPGLTWQQVRQAMRDGCKRIGAGSGVIYNAAGHSNQCGFGRVDAAKALAML